MTVLSGFRWSGPNSGVVSEKPDLRAGDTATLPCPECEGDPNYTVSVGMGIAGPCQTCLGKGTVERIVAKEIWVVAKEIWERSDDQGNVEWLIELQETTHG